MGQESGNGYEGGASGQSGTYDVACCREPAQRTRNLSVESLSTCRRLGFVGCLQK